MLHSLASAIANRLFNETDKYPIEVYVYGIELIISSIISTSLIITVGIVTHSLIESLIYIVSFSLIRIYTGGYHCMSYLRCNIVSVLSYIIVYISLLFFENVFANTYILVSGYTLSILLFLFFAPVKNENKELTKNEETKYKLLSLVMITLFYSICYALYFILGIKQTLIIFPTCITIDIAMLISVFKNYLFLGGTHYEKTHKHRKKNHRKSCHQCR